jgi:hypothetical protein
MMTDSEREWSRLPQLVKAATKGSRWISDNCVSLRHIAVQLEVRGGRYEVRFGGKPGIAVGPEDSPPRIRWILDPTPEGDRWYVTALGETLTTEDIALKISARLAEYSLEYENEIAL